jgi:hypothetical protein
MIDRHVALAAAGFVISGKHRDSLKQGRFAGAIFADDDGDDGIEAQLEIVLQEGQAKRIGLPVGYARRIEPESPEVGRRQVDFAFSP